MDKEKKFEEIYRKYSKEIYNYLLFLSCSKEDAEDILQDVFVKFWKMFDSLVKLENLRAYLFKMARNRFIDIKRKRKRFVEGEINEEVFNFQGEDISEKIRKKEFIRKLLSNLKEEEREIITLRFYENMKFREISEITGLNENTLRVKYMRILEKLRKLIYNNTYEK